MALFPAESGKSLFSGEIVRETFEREKTRPGAGILSANTSRADFTWSMTALDWGFDVPEAAARLMEVSAKAKENGPRYAALTAQGCGRLAGSTGDGKRENH